MITFYFTEVARVPAIYMHIRGVVKTLPIACPKLTLWVLVCATWKKRNISNFVIIIVNLICFFLIFTNRKKPGFNQKDNFMLLAIKYSSILFYLIKT